MSLNNNKLLPLDFIDKPQGEYVQPYPLVASRGNFAQKMLGPANLGANAEVAELLNDENTYGDEDVEEENGLFRPINIPNNNGSVSVEGGGKRKKHTRKRRTLKRKQTKKHRRRKASRRP